MGHIERKQREKEAVKNNILAAARKIAASEGWHAVTIRKIADAIEYTAPIVYEHFENKEDLIRELIHSGFKLLAEQFANTRAKELNPKSQLIELSLIHWDFAFNNKELYQLMFSLERPQPSEESLKAMYAIRDTFMKITGKNEEEVVEIIFNWVCLLQGTISMVIHFQKVPGPYKQEIDSREMFVNFINRFIESIS
jgi:AcrR family transcriptional regulator